MAAVGGQWATTAGIARPPRLPWFLILARFLNGANFLVVARTYVLSVLSPAQQKGVQTRLSIAVALGYLLGAPPWWWWCW